MTADASHPCSPHTRGWSQPAEQPNRGGFLQIFVPGVPAGDTVRVVDIPDWFGWILLALAVLQAIALVPVIRRLRETDSAVRSKARLDLLDTVGSLVLLGGLLLSLLLAESWFWLALAGLVLSGASYAMKGLRLLRARRRRAT